MPSIKSVTAQAFHYFARSHAGGMRNEAITSPCAWIGQELMKTPDRYTITLTAEQIREVKAVITSVMASGKPMATLISSDFAWPLLDPIIADIKAELLTGLGFKLICGFPVEAWSQQESEFFFWGWGLHLGLCGAQDNSGELLGHVMDIGADPNLVRQYKTRGAIDYHCDAADVVGLMCLSASASGGESTLVSSATAYNRFLTNHPDLVETLYRPFLLDTRGSGGINCVPIEPLRHGTDGRLRTFWHNEYYRSCYGKDGAPAAMPDAHLAAWKAYDAIIHEPSMPVRMQLQPGDVQMCSNHYILHARTAYEDAIGDDNKRRHLLRLWLSLDARMGAGDIASKAWHTAVVVTRFVRAKLYARLGLMWTLD